MQAKDFELNVSQPPTPIWKLILATAFFTMAIVCLYGIFQQPHFSDLDPEEAKTFDINIMLVMIGLFMGIYFSVRSSIMIDVETESLVSKYSVGPFSRKVTSKIPNLEYVMVHKNPDGFYLVKILYQKNKRFIMCYYEQKEPAMQFAATIAIKLNIDLFDGTDKNNFHLVDKFSFTADS